MKKLKSAAVFIVIVALLAVPAFASRGYVQKNLEYSNISVKLDGDTLIPKDASGNIIEPFIIDGTTYLPVRGISSALGLDVEWDGATSTVILTTPEAKKAIYITKTGSKYHYDKTCNGGTYWEVPFSTAKGFGLEPCEKCVH